MKWKLILLAGMTVPALVQAQMPEPVVNSCISLESESKSVLYQELEDAGSLSDDVIPGYSVLIHRNDGHDYGYAASKRNSQDLLVVGRKKLPILSAKRVGREPPQRFDPTKAVYAIVDHAARRYFCVASNLEGLGRSGSFQNVRAVYVVPLTFFRGKPGARALYYAVRDVREIKRGQSPPLP